MSVAKEQREKLIWEFPNIGKKAPEQEEKAFAYCEGYKEFLNAAKTEREFVREAVLRELRDLWRREAGDGATVYRSHISEAVSMAEGEADHTLLDPAGDIVADRGVYPALAGVEWV